MGLPLPQALFSPRLVDENSPGILRSQSNTLGIHVKPNSEHKSARDSGELSRWCPTPLQADLVSPWLHKLLSKTTSRVAGAQGQGLFVLTSLTSSSSWTAATKTLNEGPLGPPSVVCSSMNAHRPLHGGLFTQETGVRDAK